jgi:hypothetical protein
MATVSDEVLNDPTAISIAQAVAIANIQAQQAGVDASNRRISIRQDLTPEGAALWRVNYGPIPPPGHTVRGGDYVVEINAVDGSVHRTLRGQ